jgi:hypothetical protein
VSKAADFRSVLAATVLLSVLAGAYEAAVRSILPPPLAALAAPGRPAIATQNGEAAAPDSAMATPAPVAEPPQQIPADTAIRFAAYDPLTGDTLAHPMRAYRYVGTLGGQPIVVQLSVGAGSAEGSWYYRTGRQPHECRLVFQRRRGGQLVLTEDIATNTPTDADTVAAEWQLRWLLGRVLAGQRRALHGAGRQAVLLRADYTQAVPYQVLRLTAHGSYCDAEPGRSQPYYSTEFLHLSGPDSLRLADWQAPPPAARRDSLRRWLRSESCQQVSENTRVTLNDYDLLSYNVWKEGYYYGAHPEHDQSGFIVDLRTGREWLVEELLRPGTEPTLLKLLARHLRHDYPEMNEGDNWHWKTVPPYPSSFTLTPLGLCAGYGDYALAAYSSSYANSTTIPYAELQPLVRPGTPLARILRARGL